MGLRAKLATAVLILLAVTIIAVTIASIDRTLSAMVEHLSDSAERISAEIFEEMRSVMAHSSGDPARALSQNESLNTLLDSSRAFGKGVVYARIEDPDGNILAGTPHEKQQPAPVAPIGKLERRARSNRPLALLGLLWTDHTYEVQRPVTANGKPFATIRIGVSTGLLSREVHRLVGGDIAITLIAVLLCAGAVLIFGELLLRPVLEITTGVEQLATGKGEVTLKVGARDELGTLADKF